MEVVGLDGSVTKGVFVCGSEEMDTPRRLPGVYELKEVERDSRRETREGRNRRVQRRVRKSGKGSRDRNYTTTRSTIMGKKRREGGREGGKSLLKRKKDEGGTGEKENKDKKLTIIQRLRLLWIYK